MRCVRSRQHPLERDEYTPSGGHISWKAVGSLSRRSREWTAYRYTIADSGPGVPPAFRSRIFDSSFVWNTITRQYGSPGAGIGLYMCRQIVELHGGVITCEPGIEGPRHVYYYHPASAADGEASDESVAPQRGDDVPDALSELNG